MRWKVLYPSFNASRSHPIKDYRVAGWCKHRDPVRIGRGTRIDQEYARTHSRCDNQTYVWWFLIFTEFETRATAYRFRSPLDLPETVSTWFGKVAFGSLSLPSPVISKMEAGAG